MSKKELELLGRIMRRLDTSLITNSVYVSPAQQLRNQADELELAEQDFHLLAKLIIKYQDLLDNK